MPAVPIRHAGGANPSCRRCESVMPTKVGIHAFAVMRPKKPWMPTAAFARA
jgi:hypothetical protein